MNTTQDEEAMADLSWNSAEERKNSTDEVGRGGGIGLLCCTVQPLAFHGGFSITG